MADYDQFKFGAYTSPLEQDLDNTLLKDCDRALYEYLRYFVAILNNRLGPRWTQELQNINFQLNGLSPDYYTADGYYGGNGKIIAEYIPYDPIPYLQESQYKFPLLTLYRKSSEHYEKTIEWYGSESTWFLEVVLPPMTPKQQQILSPIRYAIEKEITNSIARGYDYCHLDGYQPGLLAGTESLKLVSAQHDMYSLPNNTGANRLNFPFVRIQLAVRERQDSNPGLLPFTELNAQISVDEPADGEDVLPVAEFTMNLGM